MHRAFIGTRQWPFALPGMRTAAPDFNAAVDVMCQFAFVSQAASRSGQAIAYMENHFRKISLAEISDLIHASRILRYTAPQFRTSHLSEFLVHCSSTEGDPFLTACTSVEIDAMDEFLEYVWRHPDEFPRDFEFNSDLYRLACRSAFRELDGEPGSVEELRERLQSMPQDFEDLKRNWEVAYEYWLEYAFRPPHLFPGGRQIPVSKADQKYIRKALKRGEWPRPVAEAFEYFANDVRRVFRHVVLWGRRTGTSGLELPQLSGGQPPH